MVFDEKKAVAINWPFSNKNEHFPINLCKNLEFYTNGKAIFNITWIRSKPESLFEIKDNVKHLNCIIYQGICSWNAVARKGENEQPNSKSEPSKHLKNNPGHTFD